MTDQQNDMAQRRTIMSAASTHAPSCCHTGCSMHPNLWLLPYTPQGMT